MLNYFGLSESKSLHVSRTLSSILVDLSNAIVWIVSTRPFNSKSSSPFTNPSVTVPRAPIRIGKTITFMFHVFLFHSLAKFRYLFSFSLSFNFILWSSGTAKSKILEVLFFLWLTILCSGHLAEIRWSVCITKSQGSLCVSFSGTYSRFWIYCLFVWSNFLGLAFA